jgi:hypothetical protein
MNKSSSKGVKLTTVILAVLILAISAMLSNSSAADDKDVKVVQTSDELSD